MLSTATRSSARVRSRALQALLSLLLSFSLALLLVPADAWATTSEATGATSDADAVSTTSDGATPVVADKDDKATTTPEAQVDESMEGTADETSQAAVSQDTASATSDDEGAQAEAVSATIRIVGVDASGSAQSWTAATTYDVDQGTTAAQLSERLFADKGIEADYGTGSWGWYLNTITSPYSGQTLGWDESTGRYWQLFVDGQPSSVGAGSVTLQAGDEVTWAYSAYGSSIPETSDSVVSIEVIGADGQGAAQSWASATTYSVDQDTTAADLTTRFFEDKGLTAEIQTDGWWYLASITSPLDSSQTLEYDAATGRFWQLYIDGESAGDTADNCTLKSGDTVVWAYSGWGDAVPSVSSISAAVSIIGADASGNHQSWAGATSYEVPYGTTAAQLSERLFADKGIEADYGTGSWGWHLNTITSPYSGQTLGWDESTGRYWQLFVDGQPSSVGAGSVTLQAGDEVTWAYSAYGDELPTGSDVVIDPTATRPDYSSDWPGYMSGNASGAVVARSTPASETGAAWTQTLKSADDWRTSVSDPIVVNGDLYLVVGDQLQVRSASDGSLKSSAQLAASADSICRLVYADGVVVVPLHGGRLQALTADTLATVWLTDALPADAKNDDQQALSTLTVHDGSVYFGTAAADWTSSTSGYLCRVSISDGTVVWTIHDDGCGYYWDGVAFVGDVAVVADDSGRVVAYDADAGTELHAFSLGAGVRSTPVASGDAVYVVSTDGVLHKLRVGADGSLTETGSVSFGTSSTTTPTVFGDDVVVAGTSKEGYANSWGGTSYYGLLAVVDAASLALKSSVTTLSDGSHIPADVKSAPLVSRTSGGAYAYFTSNSTPGAVYACLLGADRAFTLFTPAEEQQQYCMASVVADGDGSLYYVNDSGTLFKLPHAGAETTPAKSDDSSANASNGDAADGGSGDDSGGQGTQPAASTQVT